MRDDRILFITRIVAAIVVPVLWLAFLVLFFFPDETGEYFAWAIKPHMTSLYIGAGYLGGSWFFLNVVFQKKWHRVHIGFPAVTAFTWFMLFATILHWDRFSHGKLGFNLWLFLYLVTPILVPALWFFNRRTDPGTPESPDVFVPEWSRWAMRLIGIVLMLVVVVGFFFPQVLIGVWAWQLTPLTARVIAGWIALLAVGALTMASDARWTAWRVPAESILLWQVLALVAAVMNPADFQAGVVNVFTILTAVLVVPILVFYPLMERRRRSRRAVMVRG
jgi:hypothetical protein